MPNIFEDIARETGRTVNNVIDEIERSPENAAKVISILGRKAGLFGKGGLAELDPSNLWRGPRTIPRGPIPPTAGAKGPGCTDQFGRPLAGIRPWIITSTSRVAGGALAADTSLIDFFNTANSAFFTTTGRFPNPFTCEYVSAIQSTQAPAAATETPGSAIGGSYLVLINQVELARYGFLGQNGWGGIHAILQPLATNGVAAASIQPPAPVYWPYYFDSNSTWALQYRIPDAVTTVAALDAMASMAGFLHATG